MLKTIYATLAAAFLLAACAGTVQDATTAVDATLSSQDAQQNYALACTAYNVAKGAFLGLTANGTVKIDEAGMKVFAQTAAVVDPLCTPPYPMNTAEAIAKIMTAVSGIGRLAIPLGSGS